jgi:type I restriction enzyme S subunit
MSGDQQSLGDLIRVKHGYALKSEFFRETGKYVVLTPGHFFEEGGFRSRPDKDRFYDGDIPEGSILSEGALIVAMTEQGPGLLGSSALVPEDDKFLHNQRIGLVTITAESELDIGFLYRLFNTRAVRAQINGSASGTKVRHTAPERIYRVLVAMPPIDVQRRIASIVAAYDALIANNRRRIAIVEEAARLLYQEWFVRLQFPGHEHVEIVDGIPERWKHVPLTEVTVINRASLSSNFDGDILYVDIASVEPGRITRKLPLTFREAPGRARRVLTHGDVIWSCVRPNRRSHAIVWNPEPNLIGSTGFAVLTPNGIPTSYLYAATTTNEFVGYLTSNAQGAAYPAVTSSVFERATILRPNKSLLEEFDRAVAPLIELADKLAKQSKALGRARDLLLPRLMSEELAV